MRYFLIGFALWFAACSPAAVKKSLRGKTAKRLGCTVGETKISKVSGGSLSEPYTWLAGCRGRQYHCLLVTYYSTGSHAECEETAASTEVVSQKVVVDRLALETGCPAEKIKIDEKAGWSRGTETAYRMEACGKWYVCTTAAGRTDCKEALSQ